MKQAEITKLSTADLQGRVDDFKGQLTNLKLTHKTTPIENPLRIHHMRKLVARLSTELTKRSNQA